MIRNLSLLLFCSFFSLAMENNQNTNKSIEDCPTTQEIQFFKISKWEENKDNFIKDASKANIWGLANLIPSSIASYRVMELFRNVRHLPQNIQAEAYYNRLLSDNLFVCSLLVFGCTLPVACYYSIKAFKSGFPILAANLQEAKTRSESASRVLNSEEYKNFVKKCNEDVVYRNRLEYYSQAKT